MTPIEIQYIFDRSCLRKANLSEEEADRIVTAKFHEGYLLYYYRCPLCSSHHLTKRVPDKSYDLDFYNINKVS